jgi:D-arabinonate dehydratase
LEIVEITAYEFRRALDGRHVDTATRWTERRVPLVRITTRDGLSGLGEGWCQQDGIDAFFAQLHQAATLLLGTDARLIERIWQALWTLPAPDGPDWVPPAVTSAIDIALWDLRARSLGASLHELLGPQRDAVPVYASGGLYADGEGIAELAAEMRAHVARGFQAVKIKIGLLEREDDIARVAAVREAVGPHVEIVVDACESLTTGEAPSLIRRLADFGVTAIQAPLPVVDVASLLMLSRTGRLRVMIGEREWRTRRFRELLRAGAVGVLQFNPGLCGGITAALKLAAMAEASGVPVSPQNHGTAVLLAACLHLGAARGAVAGVEVHTYHDHLHDALPPTMTMLRDGCVSPDGPGLGLPEGMAAARHDVRPVWRVRAGDAG